MGKFELKILELRKNNNWLQKDVAEKLNIRKNTYGAWERGDSEPSIDMITRIADLYNVSTDYLFGREEEDGRIVIREIELPPDERRLLENYRTLNGDLKESCLNFSENMRNLQANYGKKPR